MNSGFNVATPQFDDYETPPWLFEALHAEFDFKIDAAASDSNHLCPIYFTEQDSGLTKLWLKPTFCNPPYSDIEPWVKKALCPRPEEEVTKVLLLPVRPNSDWFHTLITAQMVGRVELRFFRRRINFLLGGKLPVNPKTGKPSSPRFASMLAVVQ